MFEFKTLTKEFAFIQILRVEQVIQMNYYEINGQFNNFKIKFNEMIQIFNYQNY